MMTDEDRLKEALYALNRAKDAFVDNVQTSSDKAHAVQIKHARDIVWTIGVVKYGWS